MEDDLPQLLARVQARMEGLSVQLDGLVTRHRQRSDEADIAESIGPDLVGTVLGWGVGGFMF